MRTRNATSSPGTEDRLKLKSTAGGYTLWHEHHTVFEGRSWNREPRLPGRISFRPRAPSGEQLPLEISGSSTWNAGGTERASVGQFEPREMGRYEMAVESDMAPAVLSIGRSILGTVLAAVVGVILLAVVGVGGGVATAMVLVGFLVLAAAAVWFIYRIARGWIALAEGKPVG